MMNTNATRDRRALLLLYVRTYVHTYIRTYVYTYIHMMNTNATRDRRALLLLFSHTRGVADVFLLLPDQSLINVF